MSIFKQVQEFNDASGIKVEKANEGILSYKDFVNRRKYFKEEEQEYLTAHLAKDNVEVLDALIDQLYILAGTAILSFDVETIEKAFNRVHENNMAKFPKTIEECYQTIEYYKTQGIDCGFKKIGERYAIYDKETNKVKKPVGFSAVKLEDLVK